MPEMHIIREKDLKEKLALQCFHTIKKYAKSKEKKIKHKGVRSLYRRFILGNKMDYEYAFLLSVLFAADFKKIEDRAQKEPSLLEHISYDAYWADCGRNVGKMEAVFFSYTYFNEKYPEMTEVFVSFEEMMKAGVELPMLIFDHLECYEESLEA